MLDASFGAILSIVLMVVCLGFAGLLALEADRLLKAQAPITDYTRAAIRRWPGQAITTAMVFVFIVGALVAHFFWDALCS